jgi:hypothetical protein
MAPETRAGQASDATCHAVAVLVACLVLAGCRDHARVEDRSAGPPRLLVPSELTEAERQYGHSATPHPGVVYQPDVVMLPVGAEAIRSLSTDGLVWTLDPDAEGADRIEPGKILLLTSRAAGRVLAVQRERAGVRVVLGPADITEIVREGTFSVDQPVDFEQAVQFPRPALFDPQVSVESLVAGGLWPHGARGPVLVRAGLVPVQNPTVHRFTLRPLVGRKGVGVRITSDAGGVHFLGEAVLYMTTPRLRFRCDIRPPGVVNLCEVELTGAGGIFMTFESASPNPMSANINERRYFPIDFSIPVSGMGIPLAVTVRQIYELKTAFTSTGNLHGRVFYELKGGLRVAYENGKWSMSGPAGVTPKVSLDHLTMSLQGAAFGVTGLVMTHQVNVIVGVGAAGFVAGPYGFLNSSVAVTRGSGIGLLQGPLTCKQATLAMGLGAGVGYVIPEPVKDAINSILRGLHIREQIEGSGGFQTNPIILVSLGSYHPAVEACGN